MKIAGIDVGSTTTKAVIMDGSRILSGAVMESGMLPRLAAVKCLDAALGLAKLEYGDLDRIAATGHARKTVAFANDQKPEIMATAVGARWMKPGTRLAIDIGGQGIRVCKIAADGTVDKFITNDKCSAGTGCFLDTLAMAMEVGMEDLGDLSKNAKTVCNMTTKCTIFAESEMVSLVARGTPKEDIIAGMHDSVAKKVSAMIKGFGITDNIFLCGGVARNSGVAAALKEHIPGIFIPPKPQLIVALGAAIMEGGG